MNRHDDVGALEVISVSCELCDILSMNKVHNLAHGMSKNLVRGKHRLELLDAGVDASQELTKMLRRTLPNRQSTPAGTDNSCV